MALNVRLPKCFQPFFCSSLVRIGSEYDGGYLVCKEDCLNASTLISFGLSNNWDFEKDFLRFGGIPIFVFDASVNLKFWAKRTLLDLIKNPLSITPFFNFINYFLFFRGNRVHIKKNVGFSSCDHSMLDFEACLAHVKGEGPVFVKCDIEGSEYRMLDDLCTYSDRLTGLVIELHDCDLFIDEIESFIQNFPLTLVHCHVNTFSLVRGSDLMPCVIELTFSNSATGAVPVGLPHVLDMPNARGMKEFAVEFY